MGRKTNAAQAGHGIRTYEQKRVEGYEKNMLIGILGAAALGLAASAASAATLDDVKAKGFVQCGVNTGLAGFAAPDDKGELDRLRRRLSAGPSPLRSSATRTKVKFTPLTAKDRFTALQSGEIDMLSRNTTWTMSRDTSLGLNFAGVNYYDGQGFMVRKKLPGVKSALRAVRRLGLRADRHDDRAEPRRLLQGQQHGIQAGRLREARRGQRGL